MDIQKSKFQHVNNFNKKNSPLQLKKNVIVAVVVGEIVVIIIRPITTIITN
jgi:hypothetical protein